MLAWLQMACHLYMKSGIATPSGVTCSRTSTIIVFGFKRQVVWNRIDVFG